MAINNGSMQGLYGRVHSLITNYMEIRGGRIEMFSSEDSFPKSGYGRLRSRRGSCVGRLRWRRLHTTPEAFVSALRLDDLAGHAFCMPCGRLSCLAGKSSSCGRIDEPNLRHPAYAEHLCARHTSYPAIPILSNRSW